MKSVLLAVLMSMCVVQATFAQDASGAAEAANAQSQVRIFSLINTDADSAARVIQSALGKAGENEKIVVDERNNSLIMNGAPERLRLVEALLMKLDVMAASTQPHLEVYVTKNASPRTVVAALADVYQGRPENVRLSLDEKNGRIVVLASNAVHDEVKALITDMDQPVEPKKEFGEERSLRFELYWIGEGAELREAPADVTKLLDKMGEKLSLKNPGLLSFVSAACYVKNSSQDRDGVSFENVQGPGATTLDCEATIRILNESEFLLNVVLCAGEEEKTTLQTTIRSRFHHLVFLAASTKNGTTVQPTLFVLKIFPDEE